MDRQRKRKIAAVMAAILHHAASASAPEAVTGASHAFPAAPPPRLSVWGLAGRRDIMDLRALWQRRQGRAC